MHTKHSLYLLFLVIIAALVGGAVSAQENAPRVIPGDIVINSSFEPDASFWTVLYKTEDKVKCGGLGHAATNCAFVFKGGIGEMAKLQQVYTAGINASGTQYIGFISHVRPFAPGMQLKFFVKVKFNNGAPMMTKKFLYTSSAALASYESVEFDTDLFNPATVSKVVFGVTNKSGGGKAYVDEFFVGAYDN